MTGQPLVAGALSGLGRDALKAAAALTAAMLLALAFAISSLMAMLGMLAPGQPISVASADTVPPGQLAVMRSAAATCGLPWQVLAGIAKVESDFGRNMATSSAGAIGYGQFLPSTWAEYGAGGNPYDFHDALPAMARDLCANGGARDLPAALYAYNHADWYVNEVLATAIRYGYVAPGAHPAEVVELARAQIGRPYVWGGESLFTGFDCSGLVQWVYGQIGVALPRTAQQQYDATLRVSRSDLRPGDLVFFKFTYWISPSEPITHVGIYVGGGRMINAPAEGDVVREMPVFSGYWLEHYAGGGRVKAS